MIFCTKCGKQLEDDAKFCSNCGLSVSSENHASERRTHVWEGKIIKCPSCGESLSGFTAVCPQCGHELRGTTSSNAVRDFALKIECAASEAERINLIRIFPIPNTREDILEFMILASTNIENSFQVDVSEAWAVKFEQAYEKATVMYGESEEFARSYELFLRKKKASKKAAKQKARLSAKQDRLKVKKENAEFKNVKAERGLRFFESNKQWILGAVACLALFLLISSLSIPHIIKEYELNNLVEQVEECILVGDFDTARIKANQIIDDTGWSAKSAEKWISIRVSLLKMIDEKQAEAEGKIAVGIADKELLGKDYNFVVKHFTSRGFTNIQLEPIDDLITGWLTKDGEVEAVTIDGNSTFDEEDKFGANVVITVSYHTFPNSETAETKLSTDPSIESPRSESESTADTGDLLVYESNGADRIEVTAHSNEYLIVDEVGCYMNGDYLHSVISLTNTSKEFAIELPTYRITAYNEDNAILDTEEHVLSIIYPGQKFVSASLLLEVGTTPARIEITVLKPDDYNIVPVSTLDHPTHEQMVGRNITVFDDSVTGEIYNPNNYAIESAVVTVVFRNEDGHIIHSEMDFVEQIPSKGTTPFEISTYSKNQLPSTCEVYAFFW